MVQVKQTINKENKENMVNEFKYSLKMVFVVFNLVSSAKSVNLDKRMLEY